MYFLDCIYHAICWSARIDISLSNRCVPCRITGRTSRTEKHHQKFNGDDLGRNRMASLHIRSSLQSQKEFSVRPNGCCTARLIQPLQAQMFSNGRHSSNTFGSSQYPSSDVPQQDINKHHGGGCCCKNAQIRIYFGCKIFNHPFTRSSFVLMDTYVINHKFHPNPLASFTSRFK